MVGGRGGEGKGESETNKVVIRERQWIVREVAWSAKVREHEVKDIAF